MLGLDEKSSQVANLIKMASADGNVNYFEDMFIKLIVAKLGVTPKEFKYVIDNLDKISFTAPKEENKVFYFWQTLQVMKMDMVADEEEIKLCKEIGLRIGFSVAQVEKMVTFMQGNLRTVIELNHFKELMEQN
jgi:hypothetical protein|tara:strand:+ start:1465 stop:1863 length:399 start_codon:yes stop_codon:yes gene_type:complete